MRLHDLRHGGASLILAARVELKIVQETLGHVSSTFTRDTYTSVYPEVARAAAESTAALLATHEPGELRLVGEESRCSTPIDVIDTAVSSGVPICGLT